MIKSLLKPTAIMGLAVSMVTAAHAQQFDSRLLARYSKKEVKERMASNDPELAYLSFYLSNGFQVVDIPAGKENEELPTVKLKSENPKDINLLGLGLEQHATARTYYRIEGTNRMLMILPRSEVEQAMGK